MKIRKMISHHSIQVDRSFVTEPEAVALWTKLFGASGHDHFLSFEGYTNQLGVIIPLGEVEVLVPWTAVKFLVREKEVPKK